MLMRPLVSVIVPVYNGQNSIKRCLDSITNQSYTNLEILVIDDGSTDNSAAILDDLATQDQRIRAFHIVNGGVSNARNFGIEQSTGAYLMFVDCDDYINSSMVEVLLSGMDEDMDMVQCGYQTVDEDGKVLSVPKTASTKLNTSQDVLAEFFKINIYAACWGKLYRAALLDDVRFDTQYHVGEDDYFVYRICQKTQKAKILKQPLYQYVMNENSVMHQNFEEKHFEIFHILDIQLSECKEDKRLYKLCVLKSVKRAHTCLYMIFTTGSMYEKFPMLRNRIKKHIGAWLFSSMFSMKDKFTFLLLILTPGFYVRLKKGQDT